MESTSTKRVLESPNDCRLEPNFSTDCGLLFIESFDLDWSVPSTQACLSQSRRFHVLSIRFEECFSTVQTLVVKPLLGPYWAIMFCVVGVGGWVTVNWDRMFDWMFGVGPNVPAKYTELQTLKIWRIFFLYIYINIIRYPYGREEIARARNFSSPCILFDSAARWWKRSHRKYEYIKVGGGGMLVSWRLFSTPHISRISEFRFSRLAMISVDSW